MPFAHGVHFLEAGAADQGPPIVLIHGAGMSAAIWLGMLGRLAGPRGRRVVAIDLPGHGRSPGAAGSVGEMRDAVGAVSATLRLGRAVLVGHSLGGLVALDAALAWPDKIAALGLVTTGARLGVSSKIFETLEKDWARWPEIMGQMARSPESSATGAREPVPPGASRAQTIADFRAAAAYDARARLGEIDVPTVVITGAHDLMTPPKWGAALREGIRGARLVEIARCGHLPMLERPDELAAALDDLSV